MDDNDILEGYEKFKGRVEKVIDNYLPNAKLQNSDIIHNDQATSFLAIIEYGNCNTTLQWGAEEVIGSKFLEFSVREKLKALSLQYCKDHDPAKH